MIVRLTHQSNERAQKASDVSVAAVRTGGNQQNMELVKKFSVPELRAVEILPKNRMIKPIQGKASHETMHALGFIHEHQRIDREDFIKINYENIASLCGPSESFYLLHNT